MECLIGGSPMGAAPEEYVISVFCERMGCTERQMRQEFSARLVATTVHRWQLEAAHAEAESKRQARRSGG